MIITKVGYDGLKSQYAAALRFNICLNENALNIQFYPALREEWGEERVLLNQKKKFHWKIPTFPADIY